KVEEILRRDPNVGEAAVVGRADSRWGQRVVTLVVPADPAPPPSLDDLRARVKQELPAFCAPKELVLLDEIPRTLLGKIRRR
ncbi:MAG TPA: AMP-dependent synthetase, partial [bacterium]|nr:AMP-dependent synthetase [bacterium]